MSATAAVCLVFGVFSVLTAVHWSFGLIPAAGIALGILALRRIREAPDELTGRGIARCGLWLSVGFWVLGCGWLTFAHVKEVPYGYERVTYEMLQPDPDVPGEQIPPDIYKIQGKRVFMKGYMSPGRQQTRITRFILCPAIADCPFCTPNPKPTEMVRVELQGDLMTRYTVHLVRLGGKLKIDPTAPGGVPYFLEADYLR